ncbi:asparaginase [Noviherbaspirillum saxi]|uniref:Asparaginase n=1 Tax=Noviherbaspirillum saxi TaxID=2320863 RepID=A0A3A3G9S3_9BURK|nr:asparaginase [Noviherbaspirillum saxi]RJF97619.1 asparaginase [Noviherbaspirillum saxi]
MMLAPLVEVIRGGQLESVHYGAVAVVDTRGKLLYHAGDPDFLTFTRSTIKPFQALPFLRAGGHEKFGFDSREIALLCASHSGEPMHTHTVQGMLAKAGCDEHHLRCGCHVPMHYSVQDKAPPAGATFTQLHNNCSGKHAGFLAYCVQHGEPLDNYVDPGHPLQQAVRDSVAQIAGIPAAAMAMGIDGCSAPNYALPLSRLAFSYARLAQGDAEPQYGSLTGELFRAMTTHPELVSGSGRSDLAFMQTAPGDWVAKIGAEAVQVIGIRSAGLGIAVKIADGSTRALFPATISVLRQIGILPSADATPLASWAQPQLNNFRGLPTGEVRAAFTLTKDN